MPVANSSEKNALGNSSAIALTRAGLEVGALRAKSTVSGLQDPGLRVQSGVLTNSEKALSVEFYSSVQQLPIAENRI
jgi:hypothetical protein